MIRRPIPQETEEDILRMQVEFSTDPSTKPSATVIKNRQQVKKVTFQERSVETVSVPVLSEIKEKNVDVKEFRFRPPKSTAVRFSKPSNITTSPSIDSAIDEPSVDLESIKREVHMENVNWLSSMSEDEILSTRKELLKKLDPKLIEFLKHRKAQKGAVASYSDGHKLSDLSADQVSSKPSLPFDQFSIKPTTEWPHMDQPEPEKMAWMASLPAQGPPQEYYSARFDFKGHIIPRNVDISVTAGLHHHGKDAEIPGYTLDELLRLCRTQALNQRILALNTLGNIVRLAKSGAYDNVLKPTSLLRSLLESSISTIVRSALDDHAGSVVVAACNLLAAFLHSVLDEASLDVSFGISIDTSQLSLAPEGDGGGDLLSKIADDAEMDDEALCNQDMILGLLRMGILDRLRYILEVLQPTSRRCITDIFSILVRICRHSPRACAQIFDCPRLMKVIFEQFLPSAWQIDGSDSKYYPWYKTPYWCAVKLCRIMAGSNRDLASAMVDKYNIGDVMIRYIITEPEDMMIPLPESCQLVIESYRLWSQLLAYGLCSEYFSDLFETVMNHLRAAVATQASTDRRQFQWDRAAALSLTIEKFAKASKKAEVTSGVTQLTGIVDAVLMALMKFLHEGELDADVSYCYLIASLSNCIREALSSKDIQLDQDRLRLLVKDSIPRFQSSLGSRLSENATTPPRILIQPSDRDPRCLPSLESAGGELLIGLVRDGSLYPLCAALRRLCRALSDHIHEVAM